MAISGRHAMLVFTGGVDIAFGVVLIIMGADAVNRYTHGAVGVPMWAGIGIIMVGLGNVVAVLTSSKKRSRDFLNINLGALVLNLTGMILAACVIGFFTWGAWTILEAGLTGNSANMNDKLISQYTTIILMAVMIFILSLMAMFMDCCSYALFGNSGDYYGPPRPRYYDGPYGPPPAHIYKP
ncbi:uncharacterized protein LOC110983016 [Acanthaster planci]|uniref:Uncharacterized protein LOC110983016 n=1 Tax=Acanthaster planci TaxID=133434 RepID=A0A8B7YW65_ACAPL|nr:uncharacterized protein LOC110983016 [Acanthaster planci]